MYLYYYNYNFYILINVIKKLKNTIIAIKFTLSNKLSTASKTLQKNFIGVSQRFDIKSLTCSMRYGL